MGNLRQIVVRSGNSSWHRQNPPMSLQQLVRRRLAARTGRPTVIRIAFLTLGLTLALWGAALLGIEEVTLSDRAAVHTPLLVELVSTTGSAGRPVVHPPEWFCFTCLGVGGVTLLYAVALPRR